RALQVLRDLPAGGECLHDAAQLDPLRGGGPFHFAPQRSLHHAHLGGVHAPKGANVICFTSIPWSAYRPGKRSTMSKPPWLARSNVADTVHSPLGSRATSVGRRSPSMSTRRVRRVCSDAAPKISIFIS